MVEIRNDLFPNMGEFFEPKNNVIEVWVNETFEAFSSLFPSKEDFVAYLNSFKDPKDAELLIKIGGFYFITKRYHSQSYIKLIMIISLMEKLVDRESKFQEFNEWLESQDNKISELLSNAKTIDANKFKQIIRTLREEYSRQFGSQRNVLNFFRKHFSKEDKVKLIRSVTARQADSVGRFSKRICKIPDLSKVTNIQELKERGFNIEKSFVPYCYNWEQCYLDYGECHPDLGCLLVEDESLQDKCLKKVVKDIYQMRSDFVHRAIIPLLNEKDATFTLGTSGEKLILITLTTEDLQSMFERALKHYFDSLSKS
jgi:arsenate reductase-like glutaredoxin family protein